MHSSIARFISLPGVSGAGGGSGASGSPGRHGPGRHPLLWSLGLHLLLAAFVVSAPLWANSPRRPVTVQTVRLFSAAEPTASPAPRTPPPPSPSPVPAQVPAAKASAPKVPAPRAPAVRPPAASSSRKVVSLRPLKSKKRVRSAKVEEKVRQTRREWERLQRETRLARLRAEEEARRMAQEAVEKIRRSYLSGGIASRKTPASGRQSATSQVNTQVNTKVNTQVNTQPAGGRTGGRGDQDVSVAKKRYYAAIMTHLSRFWTLPDTVDWNEDLEAVVVLWLRRDGTVIRWEFETRSASAPFNRFVEQTLDKAGAMPPIPPSLPDPLELGIRFRPNELR